MKESEALREVQRLFAVFPGQKATQETALAYAEQLVELRSPDALRDAVSSLIRSEKWLPAVSTIIDEYRRYEDRYKPAALPEAPMSDRERRRAERRMWAVCHHMARHGDHQGTFEECQSEECEWLRTDLLQAP